MHICHIKPILQEYVRKFVRTVNQWVVHFIIKTILLCKSKDQHWKTGWFS